MHQGDEDCFGCEMFIKSLHYIMALEEGRLEIGPCGQKLPGMGSNFNSSHCSYFLFLWNILFTCFYSHSQELHCLPTCKFYPWKIKPQGFNMGEPPVNVEVKSSSDLLGTAALDVQCLTRQHAWLGASVNLRPEKYREKVPFLGTLWNWNYWGAWGRKKWTSSYRRKHEA